MANDSDAIGHVFQALADPTRRAVIYRLGFGSASTKELAEPFDMALPSFMQHLGVLEDSGLIASRKIGRVRTWEIKEQQLSAVESWLEEQRALWEARTDSLVTYVEDLHRKNQAMTTINNNFTVSRFINAPRNLVWTAWTQPEQLQKWWCPQPITCKVTRFDLRLGGAFDLLMLHPDGSESPQSGSFLDIVPESKIVFTTALTQDWRPAVAPLPITATISMRDEDHGTRYETEVMYKNDEDRQQLATFGFEDGWSTAIDQLTELVTDSLL